MDNDEFKIKEEFQTVVADDLGVGIGMGINRETGETKPMVAITLTCKEFGVQVSYPIPAEDACDFANDILKAARASRSMQAEMREFFKKEDERNQPEPGCGSPHPQTTRKTKEVQHNVIHRQSTSAGPR